MPSTLLPHPPNSHFALLSHVRTTKQLDIAEARWYGPRCMQAHARLISARASAGRDTCQAMRHYKRAIRRAKRRHIRARQARLADLIINKPRLLWKLTKTSTSASRSIPKGILQTYFAKLRAPPSPLPYPPQFILNPHAPISVPGATNPQLGLNPLAPSLFPTATNLTPISRLTKPLPV